MNKPGKAKKAVKQKQAAKHRAKQRYRKELRRSGRASRLAQARAHTDDAAREALSAEPDPATLAALKFCETHQLDPLGVLNALLADAPSGVWPLVAFGSGERHEVDAATRDSLLRRLSARLFRYAPPKEASLAALATKPDDILPVL